MNRTLKTSSTLTPDPVLTVNSPPRNSFSAMTSASQPAASNAFRSAILRFALAFGATVLIVLFCIRFIDIPLATWVSTTPDVRTFHKLLGMAEHFGTPYGQVLAFLLIAVLDAPNRLVIPRLALATWSAGLFCGLVKLCVSRTRPKYCDFTSPINDFAFWGDASGESISSSIQSFPSAHTASAVAFCFALSRVYPKGCYLFICLAILVGLHRIETASHFAGDLCAGAFVGWAAVQLLTGNPVRNAGDLHRQANAECQQEDSRGPSATLASSSRTVTAEPSSQTRWHWDRRSSRSFWRQRQRPPERRHSTTKTASSEP